MNAEAAGRRYFVYDGTNMVLAFNGSQELTDRYRSGPAVDHVPAGPSTSPA